MNKQLMAWAWLALSAAWPACAQQAASSPAALLPTDVLARALTRVRDAAAVLAPPGARVTVEAGTLDPRLVLAPCTRIESYLPPGLPAWGRTRVGLRCTDGIARWNVGLPVTVQVLAPGVVALADLPAGVRLGAAQLGRIEIDWAAAAGGAFDDPALLAGRTLARPLAAGQALHVADLQARQWFAAGDSVRIVAAGPGFSISGEGLALTPGFEGKPARVQTENGHVLAARPVGERRVEVDP